MTVEEALVLLDTILQKQKLRDIQEQIFRYAWQGWTYPEIANQLGYDTGHIRDVGSELWQQLTQAIGEKVSKNNVQTVFRRQMYQKQNVNHPFAVLEPEFATELAPIVASKAIGSGNFPNAGGASSRSLAKAVESEFTWEQASRLANTLIFEVSLKHLSNAEIQVLRGSWEGKTYHAIASEYHLSRRRIEEIGEDLWDKLSIALGEQVRKTNFRQVLQRQWETSSAFNKSSPPEKETSSAFASDLYQERFPIETLCYQQICQPGALLRIKAPLQMGKTELMSKVMHHAQQQGYRTVVLNLRYASKEDFSNLDKFLQWFMTSIALELELLQPVEEYWSRSNHNSKIKCRKCFERYLLPGDQPLTIALDEVDRLFPYQEIAGEFLGMLRIWHEEAKTSELWAQLRLVKLHTEVYSHLNINQSPFNAGYEIKLRDFNPHEVLSLALKYGLQWETSQVEQLMAMVGGHPYLVAKALQVMAGQEMTLEQLLQSAPTASSTYRNYLERLWQQLQSNLQLNQMKMLADAPLEFSSQLNLDEVVKLYDLGLVELQNNYAMPRYELYRQYFRKRWSAGSGN